MASNVKGGQIVNTVWSIAEPIADSLGFVLWDVRFEKEGPDWFLRVYIDKQEGISIDDCVDMSHALDGPLDAADPIEQSYCLEVCSPGVERPLRRDFHFEASVGKKITVKLIRPLDGVREYKGILSSYDNGSILLDTGNESMLIKVKETSYIKLDDFGGI